MSWNGYSSQNEQHAFLSPSKVSWIRYSEEELYSAYIRSFSPAIGTALHELAHDLIVKCVTLSKADRKMVLFHLLENDIPRVAIDMNALYPNFMAYVNDSLMYGLTPEVKLQYSDVCFGHADAVGFENNLLRIFDLKTGTTPAHMEQLMIYAALFCLQNKIKPATIQTELRLYQGGNVQVVSPDWKDIYEFTQIIIKNSNYIQKISEKGV